MSAVFPYEFSLDFHIFQASLCTSKGIGNRVSCILAIFLYIAVVHSADMGLNPRIAEKKKAPCFTSPLMVGALLSRDGLGYRGTSPALGGPRLSS